MLLTVTHEWDRFEDIQDLSYRVLYAPFGVPRNADWYHPAHGSVFVVALSSGGAILGAARLLPAQGEPMRQVRQVVVAPEAQGHGVGRFLMRRIEEVAAEQGAGRVWLEARESAFGFYEAIGYAQDGPLFRSALTGIPHRRMSRSLL